MPPSDDRSLMPRWAGIGGAVVVIFGLSGLEPSQPLEACQAAIVLCEHLP